MRVSLNCDGRLDHSPSSSSISGGPGDGANSSFCVKGMVRRPSVTYLSQHRSKPWVLKGGYYPHFSFGVKQKKENPSGGEV